MLEKFVCGLCVHLCVCICLWCVWCACVCVSGVFVCVYLYAWRVFLTFLHVMG